MPLGLDPHNTRERLYNRVQPHLYNILRDDLENSAFKYGLFKLRQHADTNLVIMVKNNHLLVYQELEARVRRFCRQ